jgi:glycosyltransferase involved in cell wall biosynthesis
MRIYVDLRCLQDPGYSFRGVGQHSAGVLRHARAFLPGPLEMIGLIDPGLPALPPVHAPLVDRVLSQPRPRGQAPAVFLQPSPMTHEPSRAATLLGHPGIVSCAIVYDFIPLREERYLPAQHDRHRYLAGMHWLKRHQLHCPISRVSARELRRLLGVPSSAIAVTGACVRSVFASFDPRLADRIAHRSRFAPGRYFLVVGGDDPRKCTGCALAAHARLAERGDVGLVVCGHLPAPAREVLLADYRRQGGNEQAVEFLDVVPDEELAALYARALATLCPSRLEGFSLPVAEAIACGCPVLAADNEAHRELIHQDEALFGPGEAGEAEAAMRRIMQETAFRERLLAGQAPVGPRFREEEVAARLWKHVLGHLDRARAPAVVRDRRDRPRLAVLSPYPPQPTGVGDYTAASLRALARRATVDVFTEQVHPRRDPWVRAFHPLTALPYVNGEYDRVLAVVGNSHHHRRIIDLHCRYGGACLTHDNRLSDFYADAWGLEGFARTAGTLLGRHVSILEVLEWLDHPDRLPSLFFDWVLAQADPFLVHSPGLQARIERAHGRRPERLPFCCYRPFRDEELGDGPRLEARRRLGMPEGRLAIVTLGILSAAKAPFECLRALEQLLSGGVEADLYFAGPAEGVILPRLRRETRRLRIGDCVHFLDAWISDQTYRDYLLAADFGIQLRTHGFGGLSGALLDCIAAGLPTVSNEEQADWMDAPDHVLRIPDDVSPRRIAEAIAAAQAAGLHRRRCGPGRSAYVREHSFERYAERLLEVLKVA